jgi:pilus assembly protein CpaD
MSTSRAFVFSMIAVCGLIVCGCADDPKESLKKAETPQQRYPIAVTPQMQTMNVPYTPGAGIDGDMDKQIQAFAQQYIDKGTGSIAVSAPRTQPDAATWFTNRLVELGVPRARIISGSDDTRAASDGVGLSYISYTASTKECGDWSTNLADSEDNDVPPNFGCAIQKNLAAMVADPRDFVSPRQLGPADEGRVATVLDKYRKGEPTPSTKTSAQSGAVSDVGQSH